MPKNPTPSRATEAPRKTTVSAPAAGRRGTSARPSTAAAEDDPRETAKRKLLSQPDPSATRLSPAERREQARRAARASTGAGAGKPPLPKK